MGMLDERDAEEFADEVVLNFARYGSVDVPA
jgi:hypothetical protein